MARKNKEEEIKEKYQGRFAREKLKALEEEIKEIVNK